MILIKRTAALLLALSLALAVFSSCGKAADSGKTDGTLSADGIAEETTEAETGILDYLPSMDFGGNTFTILQREGYDYEFKSEEQTGDLIEDAIYERNNLVEDLYNVKIKTIEKPYTWGGGDTFNKELVSSIMAGDSDFDIVAGYAAMILGAIQKGLFINWYDVPNVISIIRGGLLRLPTRLPLITRCLRCQAIFHCLYGNAWSVFITIENCREL